MERGRGIGRDTAEPWTLAARHLGNGKNTFRVNRVVMSHRSNLKGRSETGCLNPSFRSLAIAL